VPYSLHSQEDDLGSGDSQEEKMETTISLQEEGTRASKNWFAN
jgi:hypothetical protein